METEERYSELNVGEEELVIYDRENHSAWVQSTVHVVVSNVR